MSTNLIATLQFQFKRLAFRVLIQTWSIFLLFKSTSRVENELATPIIHLSFIFSSSSVQSEKRPAPLLVFPSPLVAMGALRRGDQIRLQQKERERERESSSQLTCYSPDCYCRCSRADTAVNKHYVAQHVELHDMQIRI